MLIEVKHCVSSLTMLHILSPLIVLLTLAGGINGQNKYDDCDYGQQMEPGKKYYVYNKDYPQNYPRGSSCRWVLTSDRPIRMSCDPFDVPASERCSQDALIIEQPGDAVGHRYCGKGNLTIVSKTNKLTITLETSRTTQGGKFLCTVESQSANGDDENCRCGWKNPSRIVGGEETGVNEYPMMTALIDVDKKLVLCGSTIINEKQVLTAAHCVIARSTTNTALLVGDHDLSKGSETNATKLYRIQKYLSHPGYNPATSDNDVAVVTVVGTIEFNQQVGPVCLPFQHSPDTFAGDYVEILGWGTSQFADGPSNTLQKARVGVITNSRCKRNYPQVTTRQMCTQEAGKDSCQFDSGGPVLWQNPSTRRIVEIGIISLGSICANGEPAQNTRVGAFIDWILSVTPQGIKYCTAE